MDRINNKCIDHPERSISSVAPSPEEPRKKGEDSATPPSLERHLYDSLLRKQKLFKMLVSEGKLERPTGKEIEKQIKQALADLEKIACMTD
jgi:hypothetical protein